MGSLTFKYTKAQHVFSPIQSARAAQASRIAETKGTRYVMADAYQERIMSEVWG